MSLISLWRDVFPVTPRTLFAISRRRRNERGKQNFAPQNTKKLVFCSQTGNHSHQQWTKFGSDYNQFFLTSSSKSGSNTIEELFSFFFLSSLIFLQNSEKNSRRYGERERGSARFFARANAVSALHFAIVIHSIFAFCGDVAKILLPRIEKAL